MQSFQQQLRIAGSFGASERDAGGGLWKMATGLAPAIDSAVVLKDFGRCVERLRNRNVFSKSLSRIAP
jgi:hypothetical protein